MSLFNCNLIRYKRLIFNLFTQIFKYFIRTAVTVPVALLLFKIYRLLLSITTGLH